MARRRTKQLCTGLGFLLPNISGFIAFTLLPLVFSVVLAFTNWDLRLHNMFKAESLVFVGLDNFIRLFEEPEFWHYLGNTFFLMLIIPFAIAGSLFAAILLSQDATGGKPKIRIWLIVSAVFIASFTLLGAFGMQSTALMFLLAAIAGGMLLLGTIGGTTVYRTIFFIPHFTSGVAVFLLWKKLYAPHSGPINRALVEPISAVGQTVSAITPAQSSENVSRSVGPINWFLSGILQQVQSVVGSTPSQTIQAGLWVMLVLCGLLTAWAIIQLGRWWRDSDLGTLAAIVTIPLLVFPGILSIYWSPVATPAWLFVGLVVAALAWQVIACVTHGQAFQTPADSNMGAGVLTAVLTMIGVFALLGLGIVLFHLPAWSAQGLEPPKWLASYHWAKPAIMIMALWGAIGSNNMLLYIAGLSNIPPELYEAADIDGATRMQRFWYITWPQLAPVTFFIVIMSVIGGLQGGFQMAMTMTQGGPAGSTTTIAYFIYNEGFETGRLGYASAIAWVMFAMVFGMTLINWKLGSRYVND